MQQEKLQDLIAQKIQLGMSHQEIYEQLDEAFPGRELDIAGLIAELPTMAQRKRYGVARYVFLAITLLSGSLTTLHCVEQFTRLGFFILPLLMGAGVLIMLFLARLVWRWRSTGFSVLGYVSASMLGFNLIYQFAFTGQWDYVLEVVLQLVLSGMGLWLSQKLGGKYKSYAPSTQVRTPNGEIRTRFKIKFLD